MKFLFASDSFKGSLSSADAAALLAKAAREVFGPSIRTSTAVVADGGEGLIEALVAAGKATKIEVCVHDPLNREISARYGLVNERVAVVESASACGLGLLADSERNPLQTTTRGVGELVNAAAELGVEEVAVGVGGTSTNDGGTGFAQALGARFYDASGAELEGVGANLEKIARIDVSDVDAKIKRLKITIMSDVTNPLTGATGATRVYGRQKGGDEAALDRLERGMENYRRVLSAEFGVDANAIPGSGSGGGLGAALAILFNGAVKSGIDATLDMIDFDAELSDADLVVVGEGRLDGQSAFGKAACGIGRRCLRAGVPVVALCGSLGAGYQQIYECGIGGVLTTVDAPMALSEAMERAEELYYNAAIRMFRTSQTGIKLRGV